MSISCVCNWDGGPTAVGDPKEMTCRTPRKCEACGRDIKVLDRMYKQSMCDYDRNSPSSPWWWCEECGDLALNLIDRDICFSFSEGIPDQWLEHIAEINPDNPALKPRPALIVIGNNSVTSQYNNLK